MREMADAHIILTENLEENRPLRRPRHRWEDDIKMDLTIKTYCVRA
jgi:hypothetical protein